MASPGRLLVLLMLFLLLSAVIVSTSGNQKQDKPNTAKKFLKTTKELFVENINEIREAVLPLLSLIPVAGPAISAVTNLVLSVVKGQIDDATLKYVRFQFDNLNVKLDKYHEEQKWAIWASGAYHKPEKDIEVAWTTYKTFVDSLLNSKDNDEKKRHTDVFIKAYQKYEDATKTLHEFLKPKDTSFMENLGMSLANHVKCHEQDIKDFAAFINQLIYKGNTMNQLYNKLNNIVSQARVDEAAKIAYESASAMFKVHQHCILKSTDYIEKDVMELIDNSIDREELAQNVWSFLVETYDRYDWMVVAFLTKNSHNKRIKALNKHFLDRFTEVRKGEVSVAVARQVKGHYTYADKVKQAIKQYLGKSVKCSDVAKKLSECKETVENVPVSQTYTAVHAFTDKPHESHGEKDIEVSAPEDSPDTTPYIYTGECNKMLGHGKFVVLIKSDEEMMTKDLCPKLNCGGTQKGTCVTMGNVFVAMCECNYPYYGQNCEKSLEDYKKDLNEEIDTNSEEFKKALKDIEEKASQQKPIVVDSRSRNQ